MMGDDYGLIDGQLSQLHRYLPEDQHTTTDVGTLTTDQKNVRPRHHCIRTACDIFELTHHNCTVLWI